MSKIERLKPNVVPLESVDPTDAPPLDQIGIFAPDGEAAQRAKLISLALDRQPYIDLPNPGRERSVIEGPGFADDDFVELNAPAVPETAPAAKAWYRQVAEQAYAYVQRLWAVPEESQLPVELPVVEQPVTVEEISEKDEQRLELFRLSEHIFASDHKERFDPTGQVVAFADGKQATLGEQIGRGNFGAVFHATMESGEPCVVKISKAFDRKAMYGDDLETSTIIRAQYVEVATLSKLTKLKDRNPGPRLLDAQFTPNPTNPDERVAVIAMEAIPGVDLRTYLRTEKVPSEAGLALVTNIAEALATVHELGLIHGDIKTRNIMVVNDAETKTLSSKLIDFGSVVIPALAERHLGNEQQPSADRQRPVYGYSPLHMTTGEFAIPGEIATQARDVYSLGRVMQYMVHGRAFSDGVQMAERFTGLDDAYKQLMTLSDELTHHDPAQRPPITEVVRQMRQLTAVHQEISRLKASISTNQIAA